MLGAMGWKPQELNQSTCTHVKLTIEGNAMHTAWQQYSQAQNLKRHAYAVGVMFGSVKAEINEVFDFTPAEHHAPAIEDDAEAIEAMCAHFPTQL